MPVRRKSASFKPAAVVKAAKRLAGSDGDHGFYSRQPWRRLRARYLVAHPLCRRCDERDIDEPAVDVHHVIPRSERPDLELDWDNLESLCKPCHSKHHGGPPR